MSGPTTAAPPIAGGGEQDLDEIWDEDLLRNMWQSAEDFGERRRIRARMYKLRELRLQEMVQNDEESLGALVTTEWQEDDKKKEETTEANLNVETTVQSTIDTSSRRSSTVELHLTVSEDDVTADSQIIDDRIKKAGEDRSTRYQLIKDKLNTESDSDALVSVTKQHYSIQNNALTGEGYSAMKNKETRDSVSPTPFHHGTTTELDEDSEEALSLLNETENVIKALQKAGKTVKIIKSEIPIRRDGKSRPQVRSPSPKKASPTRPAPKTSKLDPSISDEFGKLNSYLASPSDIRQILVNEEEEEMIDDFGNKVQMVVTTTKDRDGKEFTTRRTARTTKIVDNESDIDEILIGNPDHEVLERDVTEEEGDDGSKIKIITETRMRPDGIEYTTKNILKTSKIFDYDHPEDINYCDSDQLISTSESEETDEHGSTIRTVTETRRKCDGTEYTTKKVYKTSKVTSRITPSDDDEVIDTKESEEKDKDGNITRIVIETRRTSSGEEYTHRQVFKCRRMTLTGVELQKGMPMMDNDDEVITKKENKEKDENGAEITVVTETRRRKDGTRYTFDYILRSFKGSEAQVKSMPVRSAGATNIKVSDEDELIKEEVKEEEQKDGSTLKTIIERRRTKDGTEYLRHRIMRIPKMPEPQLTVGTLNDEVLEKDAEEMEYNGTRIKSVTERRRSSLTGLQYTLRRMSKTYQQTRRPSTIPGDEVLDENVTEEEADDGTIIKTVIRRYQRKDGTMYTTHNINKSFMAPTHVVIENINDGELIDQTMDQKETDDGYIIKTVIETYQRADGVQYTIERTEKTDKDSDSVMYTSDYPTQRVELIVPCSDDVVLSHEVEEEPDDESQIVKVITEVRQRSNGSKYTTKTTMIIKPALIPEQETSYVVITPDEGVEDSDLMPSMEDELVYTRKREEKDEDGNPITVIIETRMSKTTGEKYNVTKRVFTTDVLITEKGEKIINQNVKSPSPTSPKGTGDRLKSNDAVSTIKVKLTLKEKKEQQPKEKEKPKLNTVNTAERKKVLENGSEKSTHRTTKTVNITGKDKPLLTAKIRVGKRNATVEEINARNIQLDTRHKPIDRVSKASKPAEVKRETTLKKKPIDEKKLASVRKPQTETPTKRGTANTRSSPKESPERHTKTPANNARSPTSRSTPKHSRDASPSSTTNCCNKPRGTAPPTSPTKRSTTHKTGTKDSPKVNGDLTCRSHQDTRSRPSELFDSPRKSSPSKADTIDKTQSGKNLKIPKEPIVSLPQTPLTEEVKSYPAISSRDDEPTIEDVSFDPDLPQHKIHRPSIVREPSESIEKDIIPIDSDDDTASKPTKDLPKEYDSDDNKRKPKSYTRKNGDNLVDGTPQQDVSRRGTGNVADRYRRFDKTEEVRSRKVSLDAKESVSLKRSIFEREDRKIPKEPLISSRNRPESQSPKPRPSTNYENRQPVVEPMIVPKYFHPLGDEKENEKPKRPSLDSPCDMTSPKLIMRLTSQDLNSSKPEESSSRKISKPEDDLKRRTSRDTNDEYIRQRDNKESSPTPFSKEGSPFSKEGSPSRFVTGRPIDQGVNTKKLKKLERSLSGKVTYDDLEETRGQLPTHLETITTITDIMVLQTMLDEATTYEERRVIRGQIRHAKKLQPGVPPTSTAYRFTTPTRRQTSPDRRPPSTKPSSKPSDRSPTRQDAGDTKSITAAITTASSTTAAATTTASSTTHSAVTDTPDNRRGQPASDPASPLASPPSSPRKTSDTTAPKPSARRPSKDDQSPSRSSYPDASRDEKEPEAAHSEEDEPVNNTIETSAKRSTLSDRLTNGISKRLTSRRSSDEESSFRKTNKTSLLTRKDASETKITKITELSDTEDIKQSRSTTKSMSTRRESDDKKSTFTRKNTGDKKTVLGRRDSSDKKAPLSKKNTIEPKTVTTRRGSDEKPTSKPTSKTSERTPTVSSRTPSNKSSDKSAPKQPSKFSTTETAEIYSEPLRHQKAPKRTLVPQTDVEKIVSPYGVGPTDENGVPLFGLKALKRRNQEPSTKTPSTPEAGKPKDEPSNVGGRTLFGVRSVQTSTTETKTATAESVRKTSVTSSSRRKTSRTEDCGSSSSSSSSSASSSGSSSPDQSDHEEYPDDVDSVIDATTTKTQSTTDEDEVIKRRSQPLKDIIKLHETIVKEPKQPADETPRSKPKQKLRDNFEPSPEVVEPKVPHKTWDVSSDLATRALDMKNIIDRHESIAKEPEGYEPRPAKKLAGILKKTSTSSATDDHYAISSVSATTVDTSDFMESMTDDQITKLSDEFDRRTQDDGNINGIGSPASRGATPQRADQSPERDTKRRTSYTEITLSTPNKGDSQAHSTTVTTSRFNTSTTTRGSHAPTTNGTGGVEIRTTSRSFLQDRSKVSGFGDVMSRMAATDAVEGTATSDDEARSLLNRFLGAQVMLTGVESMMANTVNGDHKASVTETRTSSTTESRLQSTSTKSSSATIELVKGVDINSLQDQDALRALLDSCDAYEDRRKLRQRLKNISANAKGGLSGSGVVAPQGVSKRGGARDSSGGSSSNSSLRSNHGPRSASTQESTQKSSYSSTYTSQSSTKMTKGLSPFNKFQQLDAQQHTTRRASSQGTGAGGAGPLFALSSSLKSSANSIKDVLLQWCQCRTRSYKGIKIDNFSTSWNDGMAFCALIHHFYPDAFDFDKLDPKNRRYNFDLAFRIADERAGVMALLDVEDMVVMKKPDWKCVFTYIQSLYRRLKNE